MSDIHEIQVKLDPEEDKEFHMARMATQDGGKGMMFWPGGNKTAQDPQNAEVCVEEIEENQLLEEDANEEAHKTPIARDVEPEEGITMPLMTALSSEYADMWEQEADQNITVAALEQCLGPEADVAFEQEIGENPGEAKARLKASRKERRRRKRRDGIREIHRPDIPDLPACVARTVPRREAQNDPACEKAILI